jgi:hypothetical protein
MSIKLIVIVVLIIISTINITEAQQSSVVNQEYSVIIPIDYLNEGKTYPLVVCYRDQLTDSLFQSYANKTQTVILQLNDASDKNLSLEFLKKIILNTKQNFKIARDKIYLLGINQNILKTVNIYEAMNHYFAATAYITNNQHNYARLTDSLNLNSSTKLYFFDTIDHHALDTAQSLFNKNFLWGLDIHKTSEDESSFTIDTVRKNKTSWQISLVYGQWFFNHSAKSKEETLLEFPQNMGAWNLSCARHITEQLSVNINLGILSRTIRPLPNIDSILGGADVEIDGGGIFLMPTSIGMDYSFTKQRFRPYTGFSFGIVPSRYRYVEASGSLLSGIKRNEYNFKSNAPFVELSSGFVYRMGQNVQMGLNFDYLRSKDFNENIGGYKAYNGFKISVGFSVLF